MHHEPAGVSGGQIHPALAGTPQMLLQA